MILLAVLLIIAVWGIITFLRADPRALALKIRSWGQRLIIVLIAGAILFLIVRFGWYVAAPLLAAPVLIKIKALMRAIMLILKLERWGRIFSYAGQAWKEHTQSFRGRFNSSEGASWSEAACHDNVVRTDWLQAVTDSAGEVVDGFLIAGPLAGHNLSALSDKELDGLLIFLNKEDSRSADLVYAYIHGRMRARQDRSSQRKTESEKGEPLMSESLALAILGLPPNPDKMAILHAYRERMRSTHPDCGGSTRMAARVNAARDYLIARYTSRRH